MNTMPVSGVFAAVLAPRNAEGELDEVALRQFLLTLMDVGIRGFAINGATGEFCATTAAEFERMMAVSGEVLAGRASLIAGIGAAGHREAIRRGRVALKAGAASVLLPMPYFFPYSQDDLQAFCRTVAGALDGPVLLYNLSQFSSGLLPETSAELIATCENIVGIKDSGGSLDTLALLTERRIDACRIVGNDGVLAEALQRGLCDGIVSGIACALPELLQALYAAGAARQASAAGLAAAVERVIEQLDMLPVPWALKVLAEARGFVPAEFLLPLSDRRRQQMVDLKQWFAEHENSLVLGKDL